MERVKVLDCTLRDGGYCNDWKFGFENTKKIINALVEAKVQIVECGFLSNTVSSYNKDITKFTQVSEVDEIIPANHKNQLYVCMINYGEYDLDDIPNCDESSLGGIRLAFHKKDVDAALEFGKGIKDKGYKLFLQPMVTLSYEDEEFICLIHQANLIQPYAFYIVDSFGVMKRKDLMRLFYMVEHNLCENIWIGFHSHNNMQLSYSNAQALVEVCTKRKLILDCSVYGMGRGAGNLNTELFVEYLNENFGSEFELKPLLSIIDEILTPFYEKNYWGYSLPNYLSAKHNTHPNYAGYLDSKKTLTVENMDEIFSIMSDEKRVNFDKAYIEQIYTKYMETGQVQEKNLSEFKSVLKNKKVLLIAPGKSSDEEKENILTFAQREDVVTISVNFDYAPIRCQYIFLSNLRRYRELPVDRRNRCIVTSNIPSLDVYLQVPYHQLLNSQPYVKDNAGMMLIHFLIKLGISEVYLAGFDGYSCDPAQNYADESMSFFARRAIFEAMNEGMEQVLRQYAQTIDIGFVTKPRHIRIV